MNWLIRLYPARWRERYRGELEQLIRDLRPTTSRTSIAIDLAKAAIGAHVHQLVHRPALDRVALYREVAVRGRIGVCR